MVFDPLVEAIRSSLRALDAEPRAVTHYLALIEAYEKCADQENEPQLLEQAAYVIRDAKKLPLTEPERRRLVTLEERVAATLARLRAGSGAS
jgi:hypothetical protein